MLPGVAGFGELDPGTEDGGLVGVPAGDACDPDGGVEGLAGGVAEVGGCVGVPGVWACPAEPGVPVGGAPGVLWATIQVVHRRIAVKRVTLVADI